MDSRHNWRFIIRRYFFNKRFLYPIAIVAILLFVGESFFKIYYSARNRSYISVLQLLEREKDGYVGDITNQDSCAFVDLTILHPFLGFAFKSVKECSFEANNIGLQGSDFPFEKSDEEYTILLAGGSVAHMLLIFNFNYIEKELNDRFYPPKGKKRFKVLSGGVGAWRQPQQLNLFIMYAHILDGVITLDGYNEHLEILNGNGGRLGNPVQTFTYHLTPKLRNAKKSYIASYMLTKENLIARSSHLIYFFSNRFRSAIIKKYFSEDSVVDENARVIKSYFNLPPDWDNEKSGKYNTNLFRSYVRYMNVISRSLKINTAHFLQPHPHIMKHLTAKEKKNAKIFAPPENYELLVKNMLLLRKEDIPIYSLLNIFNNIREGIYSDHIHCHLREFDWDGKKISLGYKLISDRIISTISKSWKLKKKL